MEPEHDLSVRTTSTSGQEGRLKVDLKNKKRKILGKKLKKIWQKNGYKK